MTIYSKEKDNNLKFTGSN